MAGPEAAHVPAMVAEVVDALAPVPPGVVVDATVGAGGHALAILDALPHVRILGLDRDDAALAAATEALAGHRDRATLVRADFAELADVVAAHDAGPLAGALFDLGVSSMQLDDPARGFSYRSDGPLDMRADRRQALTAADVVNTYDEHALVRVLRFGGEDRFARRVARAVVAARPLSTTGELAAVVRSAIPAPARRRGGDPARRSFQALRIEVNGELAALARTLAATVDLLAPAGRCTVLAYHSGEDRIVKRTLAATTTGGCACPPGLPCACGAVPLTRLVHRGARRPGEAELSANPRAESARLRVVEKLEIPA